MQHKNYCYAAMAPTLGKGRADEQLRLAHHYKNKLVEIERNRRQQNQLAIATHCPRLVAVQAEIALATIERNEAKAAISNRRSKERKRTPPTEREQARLDAAKVSGKQLSALRKEIKSVEMSAPELIAEFARIKAETTAAIKAARKASGVFWGSYLTVEESTKSFRSGDAPKFQRWDGQGTLSVQLQRGLSVADALACTDRRLQIDVPPSLQDAWALQSGRRIGVSGRKSIASLRLRVASDGRDPVWADFPIRMHRPLPCDGVIQWAHVHVRKGPNDKLHYDARLCVTQPDDQPTDTPCELVAVHLGWRMKPSGNLRIGVISDGTKTEEITISRKWIAELDYADRLRGIWRDLFNRTKRRLSQWIAAAKAKGICAAWLELRTKHIALWKSPNGLMAILDFWRDNRFAGDERVFKRLYGDHTNPRQGWRRRHKHLIHWERFQRRKVRLRRNDYYRCLVSGLAKEYQYCSIAMVEYAVLRKRPEVDQDATQTTRQRQLASLASPGQLREYLREKFRDRVIEVAAKDMTRACSACGHIDKWSHKILTHQCRKCDALWDQDHNGAANQLARAKVIAKARELLAGNAVQGVATLPSGKPLSARVAKMQAARKLQRKEKQDNDLS